MEVELLRAHLSSTLPEYMVPAAYVALDLLPLTPNGKLDRKALPAPGQEAYLTQSYEAPRGDVETALAEIWAEVLKLDRVGRQDNFFSLGGHSLLAVRVTAIIRQVLGSDLSLSDLFAHPVLADFARTAEVASRFDLPVITVVDRDQDLPLSFAQQRLWLLAQIEGVSRAYHIPIRLRFVGEMDAAALRQALDQILCRHEALRTTFELIDGKPVQRITPISHARFVLHEHDLGQQDDAKHALDRLAAEEAIEGL